MVDEIKLPLVEGNMDDVLPFSLLIFLHKRNEKNLQTTFHRLFTEFKEDLLFLPVLDKLLETKAIAFENNIVKLLAKPGKPKEFIPDPNALVFDYDDRYFLQSDYSREDLFELQRITLSLKHSRDVRMDLLEQTRFNEQEIDTCLGRFYNKKLIQREKIGLIGEKVIFRYYF